MVLPVIGWRCQGYFLRLDRLCQFKIPLQLFLDRKKIAVAMKRVTIGCLLFLFFSGIHASEKEAIAKLMALEKAPAGVAFEIVGGDSTSLEAALVRAQHYSMQVKQRFADTQFVILSHGLEQFSLLKKNEAENKQLHQRVQRLVKDDNIPVQVCGSFADMLKIDSRDFQSFVQVVDSGPLQLQTYQEQGYVVIEMDLGIK